jgi:hypothetical protein
LKHLRFFIFALFFSVSAFASCPKEYFYEILQKNPKAVPVPGEKTAYGFIAEGDDLAKLPNGLYLYLITNEKKVLYAPRFPEPFDPLNPMASHRALLQAFFDKFGYYPDIIAGGEFETFDGVVTELNNKSNTFHGGETQLVIANAELTAQHLPLRENTLRDDWAIKTPEEIRLLSGTHVSELMQLEFVTKFSRFPRYRKLLETIDQQLTRIYSVYPSAQQAGRIDWVAFYTAEKLHLTQHPEKLHLMATFIDLSVYTQLIAYLEIRTDKLGKIDQAITNFGFEHVQMFFENLNELEGYLVRAD